MHVTYKLIKYINLIKLDKNVLFFLNYKILIAQISYRNFYVHKFNMQN